MPLPRKKILQQMAICVLNEIKDFPSKAVNPNWLEELEDDQRHRVKLEAPFTVPS